MGITITKRELRRNPGLRVAFDAALAQSGCSKPKRGGQRTLVGERSAAQGLVDIAGPLLVRITRHYIGKRYDDDNFSGGCKQLRDAIAAALSRKGDSEQDGMFWEYRQVVDGRQEITIELFRMNSARN